MSDLRLFQINGSAAEQTNSNGYTYRRNFSMFVAAPDIVTAIQHALKSHPGGEVHSATSRTGREKFEVAE